MWCCTQQFREVAGDVPCVPFFHQGQDGGGHSLVRLLGASAVLFWQREAPGSTVGLTAAPEGGVGCLLAAPAATAESRAPGAFPRRAGQDPCGGVHQGWSENHQLLSCCQTVPRAPGAVFPPFCLSSLCGRGVFCRSC